MQDKIDESTNHETRTRFRLVEKVNRTRCHVRWEGTDYSSLLMRFPIAHGGSPPYCKLPNSTTSEYYFERLVKGTDIWVVCRDPRVDDGNRLSIFSILMEEGRVRPTPTPMRITDEVPAVGDDTSEIDDTDEFVGLEK